jgi:RecB family exonuclease
VGYMGPEYKIDYYVKGTNWKKFLSEGERMIRDWWGIIRWDADVTLAREYHFEVPIGNGHVLEGTIDKLVIRQVPKLHTNVVLISDYKTNSKTPTYEWLEDNLQFTAYAYATTRPEFWAGLPNGAAIEQQVATLPRWGEWVSLKGPKRLDAGERSQVQYNRLTMAVNALAESVAMRIFVPNISGENCRYCEFRANCGLREVPDTEW